MMAVGVCILLFCLNLLSVNCHNIVGCGGFVKSDIKDFSFQKLSANLVFLDGTVNYITDILPNGAYSIPIYDFGEYVLKVVGPKGWNIEPSDGFRLVVDGQDSCNDDYNFKVTGFSVYGRVSTAHINQGPKGIRIDILQNNKLIKFTTTVEGGDFVIENVHPGSYQINFQSKTAEGKAVEFTDNKYELEIVNDNVVITDAFIIHGYPVFGDIHYENEPVSGVEFYIYSKSINAEKFDFAKYKCIKVDKIDLHINGYNPLCKSITNEKGQFLFPLLPGGDYLLLPIYEHENSKFTIEPAQHEFQVTSHSVDLRSQFKISGFSVMGRTLIPRTDKGLSNSEIYLNDMFVTKTDSNGNFAINGVNRGANKLSIIKEGYFFNETLITFDPKNPIIDDIYPDKISICGTIVIDTNHVSKSVLNELSQPRKIVLIYETTGSVVDSILANSKITENKENAFSRFCFFARPGTYIVKPMIDSTVTLSLAPNQIRIQLISTPVMVKFSQFRGTISGYVKCIERCNTGEFEVTLKSSEYSSESPHLIQHILISESQPDQGTFKFQDIVPGNYQVELISANGHFPSYKNRWCWSHHVLPVTVIDENISTGLIFEQTGFSLQIHSSHDMKVDYYHLKETERVMVGSKQLTKGVNLICLPQPGMFEMTVDTCHKLRNNSILVNTNVDIDGQVKLDVVQYKVRIDFVLTDNLTVTDQKNLESDVRGLITFNLNSEPIVKLIDWNNGSGQLEFWVEPETSIQVSAISNKYLVKPEKWNFQLPHGTVDCVTNIGKFELEPGTFIIGSVSPPIKDVIIEVRRSASSAEEDVIENIISSSSTTEDGQFYLGPFTSQFKYDIKLIKNGYQFIKMESTEIGGGYHFKSLKLSELNVEIVDNITGTPISGILLSIIGNELRKNDLTDENGKFSFVGLTAGTYYLRAMMKELEFNPAGAIEITMLEGHLENVLIKASRTSFSVYGKVVSLNGEPETGISVEADPIRDGINNSACQLSLVRNEVAVSDDSGLFRIRGLVPKCSYRLSLKISSNNEDNGIVRSHPRFINVQMTNEDVHNIKLYALRSLNLREISAMVWTNNDVYINSLQISVFPSENPDNVISIHKFVSDSVYFQMSLPQVHKKMEYVIRLQSNLSPRLYSNISAQERIFLVEPGTRTFFKYFEFDFYPTKNAIGDSDVSLTISSSIMLPIFLALFALLFYKKDSLHPIFYHVFLILRRRLTQLFSHRVTYLSTASSSSTTSPNVLDAAEISELNSFIAKPKPTVVPVSIKKPPFWLRPKKA